MLCSTDVIWGGWRIPASVRWCAAHSESDAGKPFVVPTNVYSTGIDRADESDLVDWIPW